MRDQAEHLRIMENAAGLQRQLDEQHSYQAEMMTAGRELCAEHLEKNKLWHEAKQEHRDQYESCEARAYSEEKMVEAQRRMLQQLQLDEASRTNS